MSKLLSVCLILVLSACTTAQKTDLETSTPGQKPSASSGGDEENIDYEQIKHSLGLSHKLEQLGYSERAFNTCEMGFGFSRTQNCRTEIMAVINFQLLCRDSQGTISTALTREDMQPLSGRTINWSLHKKNGSAVLNHDGHGQILMSFRSSPRNQRLKLSANNDALYLRANEIKRIVTPSNWCN